MGLKLSPIFLLFILASTSAFTSPCRPLPRNSVPRVDASASGGSEDEGVPDGLKSLLETPEIMELLQSEKMQEAMQLVMSGKQDELQQRVQEDPEFQEIVEKLNEILGGPQ